jgi:hypothetical protein
MNPSQKTEVLETELLSQKIIYTHYLFPGLIDTFVRVLDGVYTEPLDDLELNELVDQKEAFISQCLWKEMSRISRTRGTWSVPAGIQDPWVTESRSQVVRFGRNCPASTYLARLWRRHLPFPYFCRERNLVGRHQSATYVAGMRLPNRRSSYRSHDFKIVIKSQPTEDLRHGLVESGFRRSLVCGKFGSHLG